MLSRRRLLRSGLGAAAAFAVLRGSAPPLQARELGAPISAATGRRVSVGLVAEERSTALPAFAGQTLPLWTYAEGAWPPVIRLSLGDRLTAELANRLPRTEEHTSIHWHGIRLPNAQDGVPYLVQPPVPPGERFTYDFAPPDTGTFFFHSHCNTMEQLGRGLVGVLIVEGDTTEPYDADEVVLLHDWHVDAGAAAFNPFFTLRGAGRAGTYAPLRSANGAVDPIMPLPAGGDCRLRLINADPTRIMTVAADGAPAAIIAVDGIAIPPLPLTRWDLGPAMRLDIVLRAPQPNAVAAIYDVSTSDRARLIRFVGNEPARQRGAFNPAPLRAGVIPPPDLRRAERIRFRLGATEAGKGLFAVAGSGPTIGTLCLASSTFWSINGRSWPDRDHAKLPPPLATLRSGRTYVFRITNPTAFTHPIHFHGHTFTMLSADRVRRPPHFTDTVLVHPQETVDVAFVADNPGDWMLHCHVIEHQETGMMGYVRVA